MAIFESGKFQNHAGELTPTLHKWAFPKKSNPHGLQTNPKPSWRCEDWADIAATEESGELPDEMIQDLQNALEFPNDLARFVTQRPF